jgi:hypothetical protein
VTFVTRGYQGGNHLCFMSAIRSKWLRLGIVCILCIACAVGIALLIERF